MPALIIMIVVGIILIIIGMSIIRGNINLIHSYHRHRISEVDKPIFEKLMGIGIIICGISVLTFTALFIVAYLKKQTIFTTIGSCLTIVGLVIGISTMAYATLKYNKGIF